jgi:putative hemolysin
MDILVETLVILALVLLNGVFAMSEIAIVSAKRARLAAAAERGSRGARAALDLASNPDPFLATVQIGITLIGILAGAVGGATLTDEIEVLLARSATLAPHADAIAFALVVLFVTFLSLVIGELVPKRIGLDHAEGVAAAMSGPIGRLARLTAPAVALLRLSTRAILRLLGLGAVRGPAVTEEDLESMLEEGTTHGVLLAREHAMIDAILALDERRVTSFMTPRTMVVSLDPAEPGEALRQKIAESEQTVFPVFEPASDDLVGFVTRRDLLLAALAGQVPPLRELTTKAVILPETVRGLAALERMQRDGLEAAAIVDEHGAIQGFLMKRLLADRLLAAGDRKILRSAPTAVRRDDGSWLVDGLLAIEEFRELFGVTATKTDASADFRTVGGLVLHHLQRVPELGARVRYGDLDLEVVDMDGLRVDAVLVRKAPAGA